MAVLTRVPEEVAGVSAAVLRAKMKGDGAFVMQSCVRPNNKAGVQEDTGLDFRPADGYLLLATFASVAQEEISWGYNRNMFGAALRTSGVGSKLHSPT